MKTIFKNLFTYSLFVALSFSSASCAGANTPSTTGDQTGQGTPPVDPLPEEPVDPDPVTPDPETPVAGRSWKVALISDMNQSYGSKTYTSQLKEAIKHIRANNVSLVLSTGDMVAGQKSGLDYDGMWNAFHSHVTRPLQDSKLPLLPSPGNHDASNGSSFRTEREKYKKTFTGFPVDRFNSSRIQADRVQFLTGVEQNYPLNYAVTMGSAVFIALDATAVGPLISDQLGWLDEVLQRASNYPIKVVFGHVPLYPFALGKTTEYLARGTSSSGWGRRMEDTLERHKVTYYFSGHSHVYYPGHRNGTVRYISVPLLGSGARKLLTKDRSVSSLSKLGFIYLSFNDKGEHEFVTLESPSFRKITSTSLPSAISVPSSTASDCKDCSNFPSSFFLNKTLRTLFNRL